MRGRFHLWVSKILGEENGNPLQYRYLENFIDRGAWQATVHADTKSDITEQLSLNTSTSNKELGDASIPKIGKTMHFHLWPQVPGHQPLTEPALLLFPFHKQRRHKRILILFLALQLRWKSAVKEKWEQQPSGRGKLFTNLIVALKQWGGVGIAVSLGKRYSKGQFPFQSQRKAMPKNAQATAQLHSSHTLVKLPGSV